MSSQFQYFISDYKRFSANSWVKGLFMWMSWGCIGVFFYRLERFFFLKMGGGYRYIRILFLPFLYLVQALSHLDINYRADIGPGLFILHPTKGIVIGGDVIIGKNLTLVGGNVIGRKVHFKIGDYVIGDNVFMGANSVVIGPLKVGNNVNVGALACVVRSFDSNKILVGVPAKELQRSQTEIS